MAGNRRKWETGQNWSKVRAILTDEWDPIGMRDMGVRDEYDFYVDRIAAMLTDDSVTREMLADHLLDIGTRRMGLGKWPGLRERCDRAAAALIRLRDPFAPC